MATHKQKLSAFKSTVPQGKRSKEIDSDFDFYNAHLAGYFPEENTCLLIYKYAYILCTR